MGNKQITSNDKGSFDLSEDAIEILMANTHFNRFEIIEWFEGFIVKDLTFFVIIYDIIIDYIVFNS